MNKNIKQSMSRKGNCWDNTVTESFFKTIKTELIYRAKYHTFNQAYEAICNYIENLYNIKRLHSALGYKTPLEMELKLKGYNEISPYFSFNYTVYVIVLKKLSHSSYPQIKTIHKLPYTSILTHKRFYQSFRTSFILLLLY